MSERERCGKWVMRAGSWGNSRCQRYATKDGFCYQHHPDTVAAREAEADRRFRQQQEARHRPAKLARERKEIIERVAAMLEKAQVVRATDRNTPSVKSGHELGGYVKYYIIDAPLYRQMYELLKGGST